MAPPYVLPLCIRWSLPYKCFLYTEEHGCGISIATPVYCKDSSKPYLSYVEAKIITQSLLRKVNRKEVPLPSKSLWMYSNAAGQYS